MTETPQLGSRGIYIADLEQILSYGIFDADHHLYAPSDATSRYLSTEMIERAWLPGEPRMLTEEERDEDEELDHERRTLGVHSQPDGGHGGVDINELPAMEGSIPIQLFEIDHAVAELERTLDRGAQLVDLQPGPAWGRSPRSTRTSTRSGRGSTRPASASRSTSAGPTPGTEPSGTRTRTPATSTSTGSSGSPIPAAQRPLDLARGQQRARRAAGRPHRRRLHPLGPAGVGVLPGRGLTARASGPGPEPDRRHPDDHARGGPGQGLAADGALRSCTR